MTESLIIPKNYTATALMLPKKLEFDQWSQIGKTLGTAGNAVMWWLGDWWAYGESRYGERAAQAVEHRYAFQTLANAASVSRAIETSRRREVLPWSFHAEVAGLEVAEQEALLGEAEKSLDTDHPMTRRDLRRAARRMKAERLGSSPQAFPTGKYRILYADPPWEYGNEQPEYHIEQADHYRLMDLQAICDLPVRDLAMDNAVLFLWTTSPMLRESFAVVEAWGFDYKTSFVWDKVKHNMGHYNSVRHEFLLVCTRGSCTPDVQKLFDSVVTEERTEHSRKPECFYSIIETLYPAGPKIELFGRMQRAGWDAWGDQHAGV